MYLYTFYLYAHNNRGGLRKDLRNNKIQKGTTTKKVYQMVPKNRQNLSSPYEEYVRSGRKIWGLAGTHRRDVMGEHVLCS